MNPDKKEKARELTPAEKRQMDHFREISNKLQNEGYQQYELTIIMVPFLPVENKSFSRCSGFRGHYHGIFLSYWV